LTIDYADIESLEVSTEGRNDLVTGSSTNSEVATSIYGSTGTDQFLVGLRVIEPVVSRSLGGHTGVLEHEISSDDEEYDGMYARGVAAGVLDNEGGYVNVHVLTEAVHGLTENVSTDSFTFTVYPTSVPTGKLVATMITG
jgi:hypothetical protein